MRPAAFLSASLVLLVLAGCSSPPPTGTANDLGFTPMMAAQAELAYQSASGANPGSDVPVVGESLQCAHPSEASAAGLPPCRPAYTNVTVNATLPLHGDAQYAVYLRNATGEILVAELSQIAMGHMNTALYGGGQNFTENLADRYDSLELRLGRFVVASAPTATGPQTFSVSPTILPTVTGLAFTGHDLSGTLSGLQANVTYQGNLYLPDAEGRALPEPAESFPITGDGAFTYSSQGHDIAEFAEFHIHVGHSKLNLYKANIQRAE